MLGLKRKTLKTSISDIFKVKSEKTLFLLCSFFNMGFEFPDIRYNLAFYFYNTSHIKINTTLYNPEHITDASDSQHRMLELEQILDMMWIQRWLTPFLHRFKMKQFAELQYLRDHNVFHRVLLVS